jgi:hypothetical protein
MAGAALVVLTGVLTGDRLLSFAVDALTAGKTVSLKNETTGLFFLTASVAGSGATALFLPPGSTAVISDGTDLIYAPGSGSGGVITGTLPIDASGAGTTLVDLAVLPPGYVINSALLRGGTDAGGGTPTTRLLANAAELVASHSPVSGTIVGNDGTGFTPYGVVDTSPMGVLIQGEVTTSADTVTPGFETFTFTFIAAP